MKTRITQKNLLTRFKRKPVEPLPDVEIHVGLVRKLWSLDEDSAAMNMQATARTIQHLKGS
jgi:hypothetical protein